MTARIDRFIPLFARYLIVAAMCCLGCGGNHTFVTYRHYTSPFFSGRNLSGQSIAITPLLTPQGAVSTLNPQRRIKAIKEKRGDLQLVASDDYVKPFTDKYGVEALDSIYDSMFRGEMIVLQNAEKFWKIVAGDYVLVLKLTGGFTVLSTDSLRTRRVRLEGELWQCDSMEVVWRAAVEGSCAGDRESDNECIERAVCRIFSALPPVKPGYGAGAW